MATAKLNLGKVKKTGSYKGKSNRLGGGGRFKQLLDKGIPAGVIAAAGRKKYGAKRMAKWSAMGRKRMMKKKKMMM